MPREAPKGRQKNTKGERNLKPKKRNRYRQMIQDIGKLSFPFPFFKFFKARNDLELIDIFPSLTHTYYCFTPLRE